MSELKRWMIKGRLEAGCDEAGRGCLAGPVTAAAVILNPKKKIIGLNDSKQITEKKRAALAEEIKEKALAWAISFIEPAEIDKINILQASFLAMNLAVQDLHTEPEFLLIDGNRFKSRSDIPFATIVKGDGIYQSIAAASILAKTARDSYMENIHAEFPIYNWIKNKGYPTVDHRLAIEQYGICSYHRKTFTIKSKQLSLF